MVLAAPDRLLIAARLCGQRGGPVAVLSVQLRQAAPQLVPLPVRLGGGRQRGAAAYSPPSGRWQTAVAGRASAALYRPADRDQQRQLSLQRRLQRGAHQARLGRALPAQHQLQSLRDIVPQQLVGAGGCWPLTGTAAGPPADGDGGRCSPATSCRRVPTSRPVSRRPAAGPRWGSPCRAARS